MPLLANFALLIGITHLAAGAVPPSCPLSDASLHTAEPSGADPLFCVVVRTYWGHGDDSGGSLRRFLRSLQRQTHQRWEALLLIADIKPFPEVHRIVADFNDTRIGVLGEWIGSAYEPKKNGTWAPNYHETLYNLTDDALAACPRGTRWALATNGDNLYTPNFMATVISEADKAATNSLPPPEVIAFDFYSRYQRITAAPCERFAVHAHACKPNLMRWCHADLGSIVMDWRRLRAEGHRFGAQRDTAGRGVEADGADGMMAESLVAAGWKVARVEGQCMYSHAPSFQSCAWAGGVWDDREVIEPQAGTCLTPAQAAAALQNDPDAEEVVINASHDGNVGEVFEEADAGKLAAARCLRRRDWASPGRIGLTRAWFSRHCAQDEDVEEFDASMREWFPTEEALEGAVGAAREHAKQMRRRQ